MKGLNLLILMLKMSVVVVKVLMYNWYFLILLWLCCVWGFNLDV